MYIYIYIYICYERANRPYSRYYTDLRQDGLTLISWSSGRCLTWDVTVIDTLAPSSAAEAAAELKIRKYSALATSRHFVPFAIETLGLMCKTTSDLISEISLRSSERSGEPREIAFLFQKLHRNTTVQLFAAPLESFSFDILVFYALCCCF